MFTGESEYLNICLELLFRAERLSEPYKRKTRNGNTVATFGRQLKFSFGIEDYIPIFTHKFIPFKTVLGELLWFIEGGRYSEIPWRMSNERLAEITGLKDSKKTIWYENSVSDYWKGKQKIQFPGDLGVIYGSQWRNFNGDGVDQLQNVIDLLKTNPFSRELTVTANNPSKRDDMALPPCHQSFQFFVNQEQNLANDLSLSLRVNQRSADMILGVPFNVLSYGILLKMVSKLTDIPPDSLIFEFGDCHIYEEHSDFHDDLYYKILKRKNYLEKLPFDSFYVKKPILKISPDVKHIDDFKMEHFELLDYEHQGKLTFPFVV